MSRLVFDLETNHYNFKKMNKLHCLAVWDVDTNKGTLYVDNIEEGLKRLEQADELIGHNIIRFDLEALRIFYPEFNPKGKIRDTVIMSRLYRPKWYTHSLERWGQVLRFKKGDYAKQFKEALGDDYTEGAEWAEYNDDMGEYCLRDVRVNARVYLECLKGIPYFYSIEALELEQYTTELMEKQKKIGVGFDKEKATKLMLTLMDHRDKLAEPIKKSFGRFYKPGKEFTPKRDNKRLGYKKGSSFCKLNWVDFNPTSRDHIAFWLKEKYQWEPEEFTEGGKPKISETVLEDLANIYPEAGPLAEHFMVCKRLSALSEGKGSWFNNLTPEGRIHGSVNPQGTVTYRGTHNNPNLGQVPKVGKPYGAECRDLFSHGFGDDFTFLGCDMSGIEFRLLAHYLYRFDNGQLVDIVLNGDIHSINQKAAGLPTRDMAKTFIYAFIYGGGDAKLGSIVGKGREHGAKLRAQFLRNLPALAELLKRVTAYRKVNKGYIRILDGRHIPVDHQHTTLNYLLQSAGAILSKAWMHKFHTKAQQAGFTDADYMQLLWVHDEIQLGVKKERAEELGQLCVEAIEEVGKDYKLNCPITGAFDIGATWKDTH